MAMQNFTPNGVAAKLAELYALNQTQLNAQIALIQNDLRDWVSDNFNLDQSQQSYLASIDNNFIAFATYNVTVALQNGLNIALDVSGDDTLKLIHCQPEIEFTFAPNQSSVTGVLNFHIRYI